MYFSLVLWYKLKKRSQSWYSCILCFLDEHIIEMDKTPHMTSFRKSKSLLSQISGLVMDWHQVYWGGKKSKSYPVKSKSIKKKITSAQIPANCGRGNLRATARPVPGLAGRFFIYLFFFRQVCYTVSLTPVTCAQCEPALISEKNGLLMAVFPSFSAAVYLLII